MSKVGVTRQADLTPKCRKFYQQVLDTTKKISAVRRSAKSFQKRLHEAAKLANNATFTGLLEHVNDITYEFILQQIRNQNIKAKARKYSLNDKILALSLMKTCGKGYRILSKIFSLPSRRTLTNLLNSLPLKAGLNEQIFRSLRKRAKKK